MSNSSLVDYTRYSPYYTPMTNKKVTVITPHIAAAVVSVEGLGSAAQTRGGAGNYGIGSDGRIGLYVDESNSAWTSSNQQNDRKAVTIEVSNSDTGGDWPVSDLVLGRLVDLCEDVARRKDFPYLNFTGDEDGNMTVHAWYADTACPGHYLASKFPYIANEVNRRLGSDFHSPDKPNRYDRGDAVRLAEGAKYYDGTEMPGWLKSKTLYIRNVYGKYYDVSIYAPGEGGITGRVKEKYLVSLEEPEAPQEPEDKLEAIEVGSVIQLTEDAVYTTGKVVPEWVRKSTLYLRDWLTEDVAAFSILKEGGITGYVDRKYIVVEAADEPAEPDPAPSAPEETEPEVNVPEVDKPDTEAPSVPYEILVTIVEERDGFGRMDIGGWIPLNK